MKTINKSAKTPKNGAELLKAMHSPKMISSINKVPASRMDTMLRALKRKRAKYTG